MANVVLAAARTRKVTSAGFMEILLRVWDAAQANLSAIHRPRHWVTLPSEVRRIRNLSREISRSHCPPNKKITPPAETHARSVTGKS